MATMATKEQERKALEKIRKIVEDLGEDSYVAAAFEGCFEDAEKNIELDAAFSFKTRYEELEKDYASLRGKLAESERDYEAAHTAAHEIAEEKDGEIKALQERVLSADDICDFSQLLADKVMELGKEVAGEADKIVAWASEPDADVFKQAVKNHRAADASLRYYTALLERVNTVKNKLA